MQSSPCGWSVGLRMDASEEQGWWVRGLGKEGRKEGRKVTVAQRSPNRSEKQLRVIFGQLTSEWGMHMCSPKRFNATIARPAADLGFHEFTEQFRGLRSMHMRVGDFMPPPLSTHIQPRTSRPAK